jgi:hypothetical protein
MTHQIIRTMEEILELDPDTAITWRKTTIRTPEDAVNVAKIWTPHFILPAVVIATGDQVRAARKALEEA